MTNKTAIEEAVKLPTARELIAKIVPNQANFEHCGRYRTINGSLLIDIEKAIESHTAAHTAALEEDRDAFREDLILAEHKASYLEKKCKEFEKRVKDLEAKIASYESAIDGLHFII